MLSLYVLCLSFRGVFPAYYHPNFFSQPEPDAQGRALQRAARHPGAGTPGAVSVVVLSWCVMSCEKGEASTGSGNGVRRATHRARGGGPHLKHTTQGDGGAQTYNHKVRL